MQEVISSDEALEQQIGQTEEAPSARNKGRRILVMATLIWTSCMLTLQLGGREEKKIDINKDGISVFPGPDGKPLTFPVNTTDGEKANVCFAGDGFLIEVDSAIFEMRMLNACGMDFALHDMRYQIGNNDVKIRYNGKLCFQAGQNFLRIPATTTQRIISSMDDPSNVENNICRIPGVDFELEIDEKSVYSYLLPSTGTMDVTFERKYPRSKIVTTLTAQAKPR